MTLWEMIQLFCRRYMLFGMLEMPTPALLTAREPHDTWILQMLVVRKGFFTWAIPLEVYNGRKPSPFYVYRTVLYMRKHWEIVPICDEDVTAILLERHQ